MIVLENVCVTLGGSIVLKDVDLRIEKGKTGVILGSSGSGKTTILRVILGLVKPDCGSVLVNGDDVTAADEEGLYKIREKIGMVFQGGALFDSLTVGENVGYRLKELRDLEIFPFTRLENYSICSLELKWTGVLPFISVQISLILLA